MVVKLDRSRTRKTESPDLEAQLGGQIGKEVKFCCRNCLGESERFFDGDGRGFALLD